MARKTAKREEGLWDTVKTVFWALIIAAVFRTLFFQPFWIPSGSMKDTLLVGDFLFVNKMAYGYSQYSCPFGACPISGRVLGSEPKRGDVVVFRHPSGDFDYIKRLIGLPGDRIQMRNGVLFLNGQEAVQTPAGTFTEVKEPQGPQAKVPLCADEPVAAGGVCEKARSVEALPGGPSHDVLNVGLSPRADNTGVFEVPPGHYFVMGDNRDDSLDSRFTSMQDGVGMVPAENLIGRADRVIFSSAGSSLLYFWTWRADRFLKAID